MEEEPPEMGKKYVVSKEGRAFERTVRRQLRKSYENQKCTELERLANDEETKGGGQLGDRVDVGRIFDDEWGGKNREGSCSSVESTLKKFLLEERR